MRKAKYYACPDCGKRFTTIAGWGSHMVTIHPESIPHGYTPMQYLYYCQTGKTEGKCIVCGNPTKWNESTLKYSPYCGRKECTDTYIRIAKDRMRNMYNGKVHLLDDPDQQRKMLAARRISGKYKFSDGGEIGFTGTYEKDFLVMLDTFLNFPSSDIMNPSPHTYYYVYENINDPDHQGKKFYIPDFFIPSINLEIEIKESGNTRPKHLLVDRIKEQSKDAAMAKLSDIHYVKLIDKKYDPFFDFLLKIKPA